MWDEKSKKDAIRGEKLKVLWRWFSIVVVGGLIVTIIVLLYQSYQ